MNLLSVEGLPVGISMLSDDDLQTLQAYYLPIIFDIKESDLCTDYSRISKNRDQRYDSDNTFELYNDIISPYLEQYIESYNFEFPYSKSINTWYNVHAKNDHQQLHNHIITDPPAFSCVCLLKQPVDNGGQLCFPTPAISTHLKYLNLDPNNRYSNIFETSTNEGALVFFPSCLDHFVTYNQTDELRAVFSSNINVTPKK